MPDDTTALVDREGLRSAVDARLQVVLGHEAAVLDEISEDAAPLIESWRTMLRGGKRLRAAFCYWSWRAHGGSLTGPDRERVVGVGAALELFQAAALFHDDVMDNSDTRRGQPTAHRAFARLHRDSGWVGDAAQFGLSSAILLGDLSLIASENELLAATSDVSPEIRRLARSTFTRMRSEVTVGQYLDMHAQVLPWDQEFAADERRALEVIRSKSARYSVESPIVLGATLAGRDADDRALASAVGLPLGEAFQLRDDLLGVFGDPAVTGKPAGDDLREGKRTLLLVHTMRAVDASTRRVLVDALGRPDLTDHEVAELQATIMASGAVDEIEARIARQTDEAFEALGRAHLDPSAEPTLRDLALAAVARAA
ncbi:polyprenyl synthetase family protein [Sanguibacter antarcticus]|uniref:Geranylgeranyl diphosphate synthase type I n=1 Tax=Sanguibacter antarcticus TaxID=372484 RepID=A0A2A9E1V2_9MICO|nr:polyprenyl synthetase family protein [Sanguibacter antarcticus]PFG32928.1 geranylgeranyl diphosphate synthase type I [Sanguibacter antarcticus]